MNDQDIIEKKPTSPLTTSLLVISAACMIGAIAFMGAQVKKLRVPGAKSATESAKYWGDRNTKKSIRDSEELFSSE
ncbi:MAG: hypothetical protein ACE5GW_07065 [Planctomycetota bacterium]